ncbi:glutathione S-transferase [Dipodascopsis tothii]|uniref:glutathione S-transferase n=1 Tax=Dipodascopsis tothii TaxID=44089 RepID=UPI0034CDC12E
MAKDHPDDTSAKGPGVDADQRSSQADADGAFRRQAASFRSAISSEPGSAYPPEKGRYVLYVSAICPWAHRALIVRQLLGLEEYLDVVWLHWHLGPQGWYFKDMDNSTAADPRYGFKYLRELYFLADPGYDKRFTVPVVWDTKTQTIVNNESSEILRMFNTAFDGVAPAAAALDLYPPELRAEIDELNEWVYNTVNNGVYKTGFATKQDVYQTNVDALFASLDRLETLLAGRDFLVGPGRGVLTEADVRLWVTVIRFDIAYYTLFRCNIRMIRHDYPNLHRWMRALYYDYPAFGETTFPEQIKQGYANVRENAIVPAGPLPAVLPRDA